MPCLTYHCLWKQSQLQRQKHNYLYWPPSLHECLTGLNCNPLRGFGGLWEQERDSTFHSPPETWWHRGITWKISVHYSGLLNPTPKLSRWLVLFAEPRPTSPVQVNFIPVGHGAGAAAHSCFLMIKNRNKCCVTLGKPGKHCEKLPPAWQEQRGGSRAHQRIISALFNPIQANRHSLPLGHGWWLKARAGLPGSSPHCPLAEPPRCRRPHLGAAPAQGGGTERDVSGPLLHP